MGLETGVTYIEDLDETWPLGSDDPDTLDNHHRNTKAGVKGSFPSLGAAAVTKTAAEINDLVTSTGATLTSPIINEILDANGKTILGFTSMSSAANYLDINNSATGSGILIDPDGTDSNIQFNLQPKGNSSIYLYARGTGAAYLKSDSGQAIIEGGTNVVITAAAGGIALTSSGNTTIDAAVTDSVTAETPNGDLALSGNGTGSVTIDEAVTDSVTAETTNGDLTLAGNGTGKVLVDGLYTKVIDIGDWNMDSTSLISVAHGVTAANIRSINALIRNDANTSYYDFAATDANTASRYILSQSTNIVISRALGGTFDQTSFDSTGYNRGWITIQYTA